MAWEINTVKKVALKNPILIEGLPGIGNVGKIVMDYLVEKTKAVKIMEFFSFSLPNSVFITENNLVALPKLEMFYVRIKNQDYVFLTGDVQPVSEESSFEFCSIIVDWFKSNKGQYIVTLGGIGLNEIPNTPLVYITGTSKKVVDQFKGLKLQTKIYGVVGPILGISGVLLGMSQKKGIPAASFLAETFGHPIYLGLKGAREIMVKLDQHYHFKIDFSDLDKEIKSVDAQVAKGIDAKKKSSKYQPKFQQESVNYIG
jgi:uncharacterized protein